MLFWNINNVYDFSGLGAASLIYSNTVIGIQLRNSTAATAAATEQSSPALRFYSEAWDTDDLISRKNEWRIKSDTASTATTQANLVFQYSLNGAAWATKFTFSSTGTITVSGITSSGAIDGTRIGASTFFNSSHESKSAAGGNSTAATSTKGVTALTSTGAGVANFTLADGSSTGQIHSFYVLSLGAGTTITITPATPINYANITFSSQIGTGCSLVWTGAGWAVTSLSGGVPA